jgi:hypothetical protein
MLYVNAKNSLKGRVSGIFSISGDRGPVIDTIYVYRQSSKEAPIWLCSRLDTWAAPKSAY